MKTTLNENGSIAIPQHIREADHLVPGDSFELERLKPGHYLLVARKPTQRPHFSADTADDGLPVIRVSEGVIATDLVKEIESQTP
jgi:bifunctional DNA-binding transcriptional regulator/antitoxin component of YhaV-PrlF toxin-antitoxin module